MLEHLMFKGTEHISAGEFSKIIARNGGKDNAFTSYDYTAYYQKVGKEKLPLAMKMEADRMTGLQFKNEDFLPEKDVVMEERRWRIDSKPENRFYEELQHKHFPNHPYGRPVIGWKQDIEAYTRDNALDWYKRWYSPENAILILIGDVTLEEVKSDILKTYGQVKGGKISPKTWAQEPLWNEEKAYRKIDEEVKIPVFYRMYRAPSMFDGITGAEEGMEDALALKMMTQILGGGQSGRLYQALVKEMKIADAASASYSPISKGESSVDIHAQPKPGVKLSQLEKEVETVVKNIAQKGVTTEEMKRAKVKMLASDVYAKDDMFVSAYHLGKWLVSGGKADDFDVWMSQIESITPTDIQRVAQKYLQTSQSTTGYLAADKEAF